MITDAHSTLGVEASQENFQEMWEGICERRVKVKRKDQSSGLNKPRREGDKLMGQAAGEPSKAELPQSVTQFFIRGPGEV